MRIRPAGCRNAIAGLPVFDSVRLRSRATSASVSRSMGVQPGQIAFAVALATALRSVSFSNESYR